MYSAKVLDGAPGVHNGAMLKTPTADQHELEMVTLESWVPADHLVRKIAAAIERKPPISGKTLVSG